MFCKHQWKLVDKTILPSAAEQTMTIPNLSKANYGGDMFNKTYIFIMTCEKCGKVNKTVIGSL